jgi:hypothetical protein
MIRKLFKSRKLRRKEANYVAVKPLYDRGASLLPAEYLARNQSDPARVEKVKATADERRQQRNARRLAQQGKGGAGE